MRTPVILTKNGFNIGDRVRFVDDIDPDDGVVFGQEGTICTFESCDDENVGVRWDKEDGNYHFCDNFCEHRHGWFVPFYSIVAVNELIDLGEIDMSVNSVDELFNSIL